MVRLFCLLIIACLITGCDASSRYVDYCKQSDVFKKCVSEMTTYNPWIIDDCKEFSRHSSYTSIEPKQCR